LLGGTNFALHFLAWGRGSFTVYGQDPEFRAYLWIVGSCIAIVCAGIYSQHVYGSFLEHLRHATFHVVSMFTSTGFTTTGFAQWPGFVPGFIMMITFLGACAGSTASGLKTIRTMIISRLARRELMRVIHPRGQFMVKIGNQVIDEPILAAIAGFVTVYFGCYVALSLAVTATGEDMVTAFSIVASCMNNVGPALGVATSTVRDLNDGAIWLCSLAMLLGRLEVLTVLVLLTPAFWRE
jgi:trk system potassium uptake protein